MSRNRAIWLGVLAGLVAMTAVSPEALAQQPRPRPQQQVQQPPQPQQQQAQQQKPNILFIMLCKNLKAEVRQMGL
jgi:transcription initiation factor TFIID subunit TAF12